MATVHNRDCDTVYSLGVSLPFFRNETFLGTPAHLYDDVTAERLNTKRRCVEGTTTRILYNILRRKEV